MFTGNYDVIQQPKDISEIARQRIPFYMFVDEETEAYMKNSSLLDSDKRSGIWRIIVVRNVPYADPRRNGKVSRTDSSTFILFLNFNISFISKTQEKQMLERIRETKMLKKI